MASFPISYNQTVPGVVQQPRANMNVDTGAGILAEATSRMGESLAGIGMKIQNAQNAMELSTLQRKSEEIHNASILALQGVDPKDDEAIGKIKQQRDKDLQGLKSKSMAVNDAFAMHLNSEMPRMDMHFQTDVLQKKAKGAKDDFDLNAQTFLADGKQADYLKLLHNAQATDVISTEEFDYRAKNMPNDSALAQADKFIGNKNGAAALDALSKIKDPNPEQVKQQHKLEGWAKEANKMSADELVKDSMRQMNQADKQNLSSKDRSALVDKLTLQITAPDNGLTAPQTREALSYMKSWQKGENIESDPDAKTNCINAITDVRYGRLNTQKANQILSDNAFKLNAKDRELYDQKLNTNLDYIQNKFVNESVREQELAAIKAEDYEKVAFYRFDLEDWMKKNPDASPREQAIRAAELSAKYKKSSLKNIIAEQKAQIGNESVPKPSANELRKQGTKEAYQKGVELGYWK
jgi:hypothetical protein